MLDLSNIPAQSFMDLLSDDSAQKLIRAASLMHYHDGQMVHSRGDTKPGLSIVKTGAVQAGVYDIDGTYIISSTLGPGHSFGEFTMFADLPRTHDMTASGRNRNLSNPCGKILAPLCARQNHFWRSTFHRSDQVTYFAGNT